MTDDRFFASGLSFLRNDLGWEGLLDDTFPTFLGHRLTVLIETRTLSNDGDTLPQPHARQLALLQLILSGLERVDMFHYDDLDDGSSDEI